MIWHALREQPIGPTTAIFACRDGEGEGDWIMPGPLMWDIANRCWFHESGEIAVFNGRVDYLWCNETDVLSTVTWPTLRPSIES